jgi:hypothetical protein
MITLKSLSLQKNKYHAIKIEFIDLSVSGKKPPPQAGTALFHQCDAYSHHYVCTA